METCTQLDTCQCMLMIEKQTSGSNVNDKEASLLWPRAINTIRFHCGNSGIQIILANIYID